MTFSGASRALLLLLGSGLLSATGAQADASAGCGKQLPAAQQPAGGASHPTDFTMKDGTKRSYLIHIPSGYSVDQPQPLIFSFHGHGKSAASQEKLSQFSDESYNPKAIAVYPQGLNTNGGESGWEGDPRATAANNDREFVAEMMDHFNERYCVDTDRYYAAGKSNGAGFVGVLACDPQLSQRIAAFAPVSGAFYVPTASGDCAPQTISLAACQPGTKQLADGTNPLPILEFHGFADTTIPYAGGARNGQCLPTIPHWVREWSKREGYGLSNRTTSLSGGNVLKYEYAGEYGRQGIVTHYRVNNLGHAWPSLSPNSDNSQGSYIEATSVIMEFFNRYTLRK